MNCGLFTVGALENIDYNPSSTTTQGSFHGTGISLFQFPDSSVSGSQSRPSKKRPPGKPESSKIDRDPHWYTRRVKEAIHIRLHPNNINRDSGIEIPEAWIPTIRNHNSRPTKKRTCEGTTPNSRNNNEERNAPIAANHHATNSDT